MSSRSSRCRRCSSPDSSGRSWRRGPITARRDAQSRRLVAPRREPRRLASLARSPSRLALRRSARRARPQRLHGQQALCVLSALGRDGGSRACACRDERGRHRAARVAVAARAFLLFALALPVADALYRLRPACRWSRRSLSRPIPIAPRTRIRPPSPPGGSIISTNGSATTASGRRSTRRTRKRNCPSSWFPAVRGACSTRRSASTISAFAGRTCRATRATRSASSRSASRRPSGRRCATARSPGRSCCRTCSTEQRRAAAGSRSSTREPRPIRSRTISSACAATSCRSSPISSSARMA